VSHDLIHAVLAVVLGAPGLFLMLPHSHGATRPKTAHIAGGVLAGLALLFFAMLWKVPASWVLGLLFYTMAFAAVISAALMVTSKDPIHSALWFAAVVLSASGLFLLAGASFLAAGTVIVYAGAIIVTFLFVIMLAQMEGRAVYDRAARMPFRATWTCFILFLAVVWAVVQTPASMPADLTTQSKTGASRNALAALMDRAVRPTAHLTAADDEGNTEFKPHVAGLAETLYTDHLVTVELAGALLFVALVGALAIAAPKPHARPGAVPSSNGSASSV
jgi:NADH-quinone oxidoreductase subunit J